MKRISIALLTLLFVIPGQALACTCEEATASQYATEATHVFAGKVTAIKPIENVTGEAPTALVTFAVSERLKERACR